MILIEDDGGRKKWCDIIAQIRLSFEISKNKKVNEKAGDTKEVTGGGRSIDFGRRQTVAKKSMNQPKNSFPPPPPQKRGVWVVSVS